MRLIRNFLQLSFDILLLVNSVFTCQNFDRHFNQITQYLDNLVNVCFSNETVLRCMLL